MWQTGGQGSLSSTCKWSLGVIVSYYCQLDTDLNNWKFPRSDRLMGSFLLANWWGLGEAGLRRVRQVAEKVKQASKQHPSVVPALNSCLEFLSWFPFIVDYSLQAKINPFFPDLLVVMVVCQSNRNKSRILGKGEWLFYKSELKSSSRLGSPSMVVAGMCICGLDVLAWVQSSFP